MFLLEKMWNCEEIHLWLHMLYLCVAVWTAVWDPACMKVLWMCIENFLIVVFQGLKHCLCLMWFVLPSMWSGNTDSMMKVVTDVCQVINRVLSIHQQAEHHQVSFCWQQVPCLVWTDVQYCRTVGHFAGNEVWSPVRDRHGRLSWVFYVVW